MPKIATRRFRLAAALFSAGMATVSVAEAEPLRLFTEDYTPFNFRENGRYVGIGADQVIKIMDRAGIPYSIEMVPWARAIGSAGSDPMTCVFTTAHTEDRDGKFKWVEPLILSPTTLMKRAGSGITPKSLDEAKKLIVGTQRNDFTHELLVKHGFPKIELTSVIDLSVKQLIGGRVDLVMVSSTYYDQLKREGVPVEAVLQLDPLRYAIACNPSVPDTIITSMQGELDKLIASEEQKNVITKYKSTKENEHVSGVEQISTK